MHYKRIKQKSLIDSKFSYLRYNFIVFLKLMEIVPKKIFKFLIFGKDKQLKRYFWERLGFVSGDSLSKIRKSRPIWIHANSLGEVIISEGLIKLIKEQDKSKKIILTTTNFPADKKAKGLTLYDHVFFFPYDFPFIIKRILRIFNPSSVIFVENDFCPNFLRICAARKIPIALVSGRFCNLRYFYNYQFRLDEEVFKYIDMFCVRSERDASQFMNYLPDSEKIKVMGDLKFAQFQNLPSENEIQPLRNLLNLNGNNKIFVAGSIHKGEDEIIFDAFLKVKNQIPDAFMIIAPRYLEKVKSLKEIAETKGLSFICRTDLFSKRRENQDVLILDTMGELVKFYAVSTVTFVGGSLVPEHLAPLGFHCEGHNILEPAIFGKSVLFGPRMNNFRSLADLFIKQGVGNQVENSEELALNITELLLNENKRKEVSKRLSGIFKENRNVLDKTIESLKNFL